MSDPVTLLLGDCLERMRELPDESVDAVVTDPPYGLEFMGKEWDRFRTDDPGTARHRGEHAGSHGEAGPGDGSHPSRAGVAVAFGGGKRPKTNRCVGCGKRDQFRNPHSCPPGTAWREEILDPHAAPPTLLAFQEWCRVWALEAYRVAKPGAHLLAFGGTRTYHRLAAAIEDAGWEIRDCLVWAYASGFPKSLDVSKAIDRAAGAERQIIGHRKNLNRTAQRSAAAAFHSSEGGMFREDRDTFADTAPATDDAKRWDGWGTALKPAWEPIVMARKPLRGTVAHNVQEYGTGALNIDGTRIPGGAVEFDVDSSWRATLGGTSDGWDSAWKSDLEAVNRRVERARAAVEKSNRLGRWPANLLLSDPELFDEPNPGVVGSGATVTSGLMQPTEVRNKRTVFGQDAGDGYTTIETYGDTGGYSRFFAIPRRSDSCWLCGRARFADGSSSPLRPSADSARSPVPTEASSVSDTTTDSRTTSAIESGFWSDGEPSTQPTPRSRRRAISPASGHSSSHARSQGAASPEIGTTTTTADRWTCDTCAALTTSPTTSESLEQGDYSRFLLVPKASRSDREPLLGGLSEGDVHPPGWADGRQWDIPGSHSTKRQNVHPTVKPIDLMRHLVRLVTPPGGLVLDPFLGSGTTAIAALEEGFRCIGIEKEPEYMAIAEARLNGRQVGLGLNVPAAQRKRGKSIGQHSPVTRQNKPRPEAAFQWKGWQPPDKPVA